MRTTVVFAVIEDGKEVWRGSAWEIYHKFDLPSKDIVYSYDRTQHCLYGKYRFKRVGVKQIECDRKVLRKERKKPKQTKHEYDLEWIRIALNKPPYYMTGYHNDGHDFVEELMAEGITFKAEKKEKKYYHLIRT